MRVLHVTKTSDGSFWAIRQVAQLVIRGVEVHAVLPSADGAAVDAWRASGATLHFLDCSLPVRTPAAVFPRGLRIRRLVESLQPDLIHTHHVTTTLMIRLALGWKHSVPRIFQVPGPLHLEHRGTRNCEIALAGAKDYWIASSRFILRLYQKAGIAADRLFLSYYTSDTKSFSNVRTGYLRRKLGIPEHAPVVGNINLIYPPKRYLGHTVGLKCHEDIIAAIAMVREQRSEVWGVLAGGTFGTSNSYERKLRALAEQKGNGRILMPGQLSAPEVARSWPDFDCAIHVPLSENCGGVVEPLLSGVPVIAGDVGGLPEVIQPGRTGELVPIRNPERLAEAVLDALDHGDKFRRMAQQGTQLVKVMFDPARCGDEVLSIYRHLLFGEPRPEAFDSEQFLRPQSQVDPAEARAPALTLAAATCR
jgi:glycosyltransferase involved in cell wall biosynthesis